MLSHVGSVMWNILWTGHIPWLQHEIEDVFWDFVSLKKNLQFHTEAMVHALLIVCSTFTELTYNNIVLTSSHSPSSWTHFNHSSFMHSSTNTCSFFVLSVPGSLYCVRCQPRRQCHQRNHHWPVRLHWYRLVARFGINSTTHEQHLLLFTYVRFYIQQSQKGQHHAT